MKAVVVRLNSPGGTLAGSEGVFLTFAEVRRHKPVVVAVDDMAVSGGYLAALGANAIYVKPMSLVGNVGAIFYLPRDIGRPLEDVVATGPFKTEGASYRMYVNLLEMVKEAFWATVQSQRGERLASPERKCSPDASFRGWRRCASAWPMRSGAWPTPSMGRPGWPASAGTGWWT